MKKNLFALLLIGLLVLPVTVGAAFADVQEPGGGVSDPTTVFTGILSILWKIFIGLAVVMFLYAGFLFITSAGSPEKVSAARQSVLWGVVGVIMAIIAYSIPLMISTAVGG